jgi:hypothetical protein
VDNMNSQKRSSRVLAMTDSGRVEMVSQEPSPAPRADLDCGQYLDHSFDLIALVRSSRERAQREIDQFGNADEYEICQISGQRTDLIYAELPEQNPASGRRNYQDRREAASGKLRNPKRRKKEEEQPGFEFESSQLKSEEPDLPAPSLLLRPDPQASEPRIRKA